MEEALLKRVLPHSMEAEQSVLSSMLIKRDAIIVAFDILSAEDFYSKQNAMIFEAIIEIYNEAKDVDLVLLQDKLKEKSAPPMISSLEYLRDILNIVPISANIKDYANIVKEKSILRKLIKINEDIADNCYSGKEGLDEILAKTEKNIFELLQEKKTFRLYTYSRDCTSCI